MQYEHNCASVIYKTTISIDPIICKTIVYIYPALMSDSCLLILKSWLLVLGSILKAIRIVAVAE